MFEHTHEQSLVQRESEDGVSVESVLGDTLTDHARETNPAELGVPYSGAIGSESIRPSHFGASETESSHKVVDPALEGYLNERAFRGEDTAMPGTRAE